MTCRAVISRRIVTNGLTLGDISVMTICTSVSIWTGVDKRHTSKGRGVMANVAFLSGWYVVRKRTDTNSIVVARRAAACNHADMIKRSRAESPRGMAVATILITGRTRIVRIGWHVRIESCGKWLACGGNLR